MAVRGHFKQGRVELYSTWLGFVAPISLNILPGLKLVFDQSRVGEK